MCFTEIHVITWVKNVLLFLSKGATKGLERANNWPKMVKSMSVFVVIRSLRYYWHPGLACFAAKYNALSRKLRRQRSRVEQRARAYHSWLLQAVNIPSPRFPFLTSKLMFSSSAETLLAPRLKRQPLPLGHKMSMDQIQVFSRFLRLVIFCNFQNLVSWVNHYVEIDTWHEIWIGKGRRA